MTTKVPSCKIYFVFCLSEEESRTLSKHQEGMSLNVDGDRKHILVENTHIQVPEVQTFLMKDHHFLFKWAMSSEVLL